MTDYWGLSDAEAEAAFQEFLEERDPALERLRQVLEAEGQDPDVVLDYTVKSLHRLWPWVKSALTERDPAANGLQGPKAPSWLRYSIGNKPTLSPESIEIVDGLISYVCRVVERAAPHARWRVGHRPIKNWVWQNHPVLAVGEGGWALAELVQRTTHPIGGRIVSKDDEMALRVKAIIDDLKRTRGPVDEDEPLVEVEDLGDHPVHGRELELSLREDIVHKHTWTVSRMGRKLAREDGITRVIREDREVFLVTTSSWTPDRLEDWANRYLDRKIRR